ncbi:hypothetical protein BT69DRAFT_128820 [Atractiella rhizophila]|nr:hypothetical protein BT69DRAFT_128820 [Atractiella rhizophila]
MYEQSVMDDIESVIYCVIYFFCNFYPDAEGRLLRRDWSPSWTGQQEKGLEGPSVVPRNRNRLPRGINYPPHIRASNPRRNDPQRYIASNPFPRTSTIHSNHGWLGEVPFARNYFFSTIWSQSTWESLRNIWRNIWSTMGLGTESTCRTYFGNSLGQFKLTG